jgi:anti-sigma factor (TIGR02949 family)
MISCAEAVRQLWDYLEREVPPEQATRIEEHLALCRTCCGEIEFAGELRRFLTDHATVDLPADAEARLLGFLENLGDPA